jgi:hypothetical protein
MFRLVAVLNVVSQSLESYWPGKDAIPATYNRNATAHTVPPQQLSELNSLFSLLLVITLLKRLRCLCTERVVTQLLFETPRAAFGSRGMRGTRPKPSQRAPARTALEAMLACCAPITRGLPSQRLRGPSLDHGIVLPHTVYGSPPWR